MRSDRVVLSATAIIAIAGTFLLLGMVVGAFGPLLEHLTHRFGVSLPVAGSTISIYFAGSLAGVFAAMRAVERLTGRAVVMTANAVSAVGCAVVAFAPSWVFFLAGVLVIGLGFGALVLALNQLVAYSEGRRRAALLNALNSAYSGGAVVGPVLVAAFAADRFSVLYLAAGAAALVLAAGASRIEGRLPVRLAGRGRPELLVLIFVAAFVLYVAVENGTGGWMASHLESVGVRSQNAAALTSAFFLALMTGRLLIALVPATISEARIVVGASAFGAVALALASIHAVAPVAYVVAGFAVAPIFPTGIVWLSRLRPGDSRATAWLYPAASIGGITGPGVIALVIAGAGVGWTPVVLAAVAAAMATSFWIANRYAFSVKA